MSKTNYTIIKSAQSRQYFNDFSLNLFREFVKKIHNLCR